MQGIISISLNKFTNIWYRPADPRVYALFRIAFSIAALVNLVDLWFLRFEFFSEKGMVNPVVAYLDKWNGTSISIFPFFNSEQAVTAIFIIAATYIVFLGIGFLSRFSVILVYFWQLSYVNANSLILCGWDSILTIYAFIMIFSPISETWSLDSYINQKFFKAEIKKEVPAYGLILMRFQAFIIYLSVALLRLPNPFWGNGDLLTYVLLSEYFHFSAPWVVHFQYPMAVLNYLFSILEFTIPFLLLSSKFRGLGFILGYSFHILIAISTNIYIFQICMMILYLPFLSRPDELNEVFKKLKKTCSFKKQHSF
jgi:hypothetical protein